MKRTHALIEPLIEPMIESKVFFRRPQGWFCLVAILTSVLGYGCGGGPSSPAPPAGNPPLIDSFQPTEGYVGDTVVVWGGEFAAPPNGTTVTFGAGSGGSGATSVTPASASELRAPLLVGAATGRLTVTTAFGSATSDIYFIVMSSAGTPPEIGSIEPLTGEVGDPVTVRGAHFDNDPLANHVMFNGVMATVQAATESTLATAVPPGATPGPLAVTTSGGQAVSETLFTVGSGGGDCTTPTTVSGTISGVVSWTTAACPIVILGGATIAPTARVTVAPGVVVKLLGAQTRLRVEGELVVQGTASTPVIFTSYRDDSWAGDTNGDGIATRPAAGDWGTVEFATGSRADLHYTQACYGGGGEAGCFDLDSRATVDHCTFAHHGGYGLAATALPQSVSITNCTFYDNWRPLLIHPGLNLGTTNAFSASGEAANDQNAIFVAPGTTPTGTVTWEETEVPFAIVRDEEAENIFVRKGSQLHISPGVIVKLQGAGADLTVLGDLDAVGDPAQKIVITSFKDDLYGGDTNGDGAATSPARGDWDVIDLGLDSRATLQDVRIRYGGCRGWATEGQLNALPGSGAEITNCEIVQSASNGVALFGGYGRISGCTITNNARHGIRCSSGEVWYEWGGETLLSGNTFAYNETPHVFILLPSAGAPPVPPSADAPPVPPSSAAR